MARPKPSPARIVLYTLLGAALFVATATLFANLLRPVTPAKALREADMAAESMPEPGEVFMAGDDTEDTDGPGQPAADEDSTEIAVLPDVPLIAIVVTELGTDVAAAERAIGTLPKEISLTFTPYAGASSNLARAARADGHEALLSIPMQPQSWPRVSPGPNTLRTGVSDAQNIEALEWALSRFEELDGTTGMMGSAFTRDATALEPVMKALHLRGLSFIDQRASGASVAESVARASGVPSRTNDRFIDEPADRAVIDRRLAELVSIAKRRGWAIGYARPLPLTVEALAEFAARAEQNGVTLVGVSRLVRGLPEDA